MFLLARQKDPRSGKWGGFTWSIYRTALGEGYCVKCPIDGHEPECSKSASWRTAEDRDRIVRALTMWCNGGLACEHKKRHRQLFDEILLAPLEADEQLLEGRPAFLDIDTDPEYNPLDTVWL